MEFYYNVAEKKYKTKYEGGPKVWNELKEAAKGNLEKNQELIDSFTGAYTKFFYFLSEQLSKITKSDLALITEKENIINQLCQLEDFKLLSDGKKKLDGMVENCKNVDLNNAIEECVTLVTKKIRQLVVEKKITLLSEMA